MYRTTAVRNLAQGQRVRIDMHAVPGRGIAPAHGWVTVETVIQPVLESTILVVLWRAGTATGAAVYSGVATVLAEPAPAAAL